MVGKLKKEGIKMRELKDKLLSSSKRGDRGNKKD